MAMDLERQREVGARIKELRGPKPQPVIADEVGVTLRAYQAWEAGDSGIAWENLQKLATVFNVSENYLLYGTPEPGASTTEQGDALHRIDLRLARLEQALLGDEQPIDFETAAAESLRAAEAGPPGISQEAHARPAAKRAREK